MKNILYYDKPADSWEEGNPVGNGRLGVMVTGKCLKEVMALNEDTLWSGYPADYTDERVYPYLEKVRKAVFEKEYKKAEELLNCHMTGVWTESYLPMADLGIEIKFTDKEAQSTQETYKTNKKATNPDAEITDYKRILDLSTAVSTVNFQLNSGKISREIFASFPDQVIVIKMEMEQFHTVEITLSSKLKGWNEIENFTLFFHGWCPEVVEPSYYECENPIRYAPFENAKSIKFKTGVKVGKTDGQIEETDGKLIISNCRSVLLLVSSANSYISYDQIPNGEYEHRVRQYLNDAGDKSYEELLFRHKADYQILFNRTELELGHSEQEKLPVDKRLKAIKKLEDDPELVATAFQFGRYLTIASSREGSQPTNLQGIWNDKLRAPWSSNYTVNINTEMNYWPAERCNLSECVEPLIKFIQECAKTGEKTARVNYHCSGWCMHHNVDLWRKTTAVGPRNAGELNVQPWSFWLASGGWLCRHLWEHYLFTNDRRFLEETAFPLMKGCAEFYLDWLVEKDGMLVTCPSTSPENMFIDQGISTGISYASTMDIQVIKELFSHCIAAMDELKRKPDAFCFKMINVVNKLPKSAVGKHGQLLEWIEDYEENEVTHRHLSHLYGLYPSELFTQNGVDLQMKKACETTLKRRGNDGVAWSRAWKIALWARLGDKEEVGEEILRYLQLADSEDAKEISYINGGIYDNLFAARPLQSDGCFGFTAGIAELLVQDEGKAVKILPAIPSAWKKGYVKGLRLRNGEIIDIEWDGKNVKSNMYRR